MPASAQKKPIVASDLYRIAYIEAPRVSPDGRWIAYVHMTVDRMENGYKRSIWLAPTGGGKPIRLTRGSKDSQPRWSPDGSMLAFTSVRGDKPQVYLIRVGEPGGEARALTSMPNGATSPAWSPDGSQIAFLAGMNAEERAIEDSGEEEEPPADKFEAKQREERKEHQEKQRWDPRPLHRIPYREGTSFNDDRFAQVYVMPVDEGLTGDAAKPRRLTAVDANHDQPEWTPDGRYILTARTVDPEKDEPFRWMSLFRIRVKDGQNDQLTDETHSDNVPTPSPDGKRIAYVRVPVENMSAAQTRLTVMPSRGGKPRDLTLEFDRAVSAFEWSPDSSMLYFVAPSLGDTLVYRVPADGGEVEQVVSGHMETQYMHVGPDGGVAFAASTPMSPPELFWQPARSTRPRQLTSANKDFLDSVIVQKTQEMHFKSPSGVTLQGWYILPIGYEQGKKYPLAFNVHGGPHVMWSSSARSMWHEWQFHAASGYAVFYCNPRGADGYGQQFTDDLHAAWGDVAFDDLMAGIDALLKKGFVDEKRMALTGGSYGGYMTGWIVGHTNRFKCAVTQRGVYNLLSFYGTSDVPMLISNEYDVEPWEDPDLLWQHSPLAYAHKVRTPLLIIASENDYRVPIEQSEQLFAFIRRATNTPVELVRYPRDGHELSRSGEPDHRISRLKRMLGWFDKYCQPSRARKHRA